MNLVDTQYSYKIASADELDLRWERNIAQSHGDERWIAWKNSFVKDNETGKCRTFVILFNDEPVGEGTLLFSPDCEAINGRTELADGISTTNINALRVEKAHEGKGHISKLVTVMEQHAIAAGYQAITIGVEAREARNLGIYLHWGYDTFIKAEEEEGALVLYYSKRL